MFRDRYQSLCCSVSYTVSERKRIPKLESPQFASRVIGEQTMAATSHPSFPFARPADTQPPSEYAELRSKCPVSQASLFDGTPVWLITKHKDLCSVLQDDRFSKVRTHPGFPELSEGGKKAVAGKEPTFVDMDPPEHTKYRGMVEHLFTPEKAEEMRPGIMNKVNELIDQMESRPKPVDLAEAFSMPLAFKVIYEMLGIPFEDYGKLSGNVAVRASGSSTARDAAAAAEDLNTYMDKLVAAKEANPVNDMISELVVKQLCPGHISRPALVQKAFLLLVAGNATVASMINLGILTLIQHPDQLEALKKEVANQEGWEAGAAGPLLQSAVEEILRYHTASAYALRRVAKEDVSVHGVTIKKGEGVIALNQSANRDEELFLDPDRFDIHRQPNPHVAFGSGTHVCIAEFLSRVELQCALGGLLRRLPGLALAVPPSEVKYTPPERDVGVVQLPITW